MAILLKLLRESIISAFQELYNSKLRAFLSLLGITIGIFCIISVYTAVDSLEKNVRQSFQKLGENVLYVQKFPWNEDPRKSWWKYVRRPVANYNEFKWLKDKLQTAEGVCIMLFVKNKLVKYKNSSIENLDILAVTHDYDKIRELEFESGRYFSLMEAQRGVNNVVIGNSIATTLFPNQDDVLGKEIKVFDRKVRIIGVLKKEGEDVIGFSSDNNVIMNYNFVKTIVDVDGMFVEPFIAVKGKEGVSIEELKDEVQGVMRSVRKLRPAEEDNFAINQLSIISGALNMVFGVINLAGGAIGLFAILVGGFGIANIMFVSVKERTHIIGIKKALGAKRFFILMEFLIEAVVLCLLGGLLGLFFVYIESHVLEALVRRIAEIEFSFILSWENISLGILLSVVIGLVAGFIPALSASMMRPVDAIRA